MKTIRVAKVIGKLNVESVMNNYRDYTNRLLS